METVILVLAIARALLCSTDIPLPKGILHSTSSSTPSTSQEVGVGYEFMQAKVNGTSTTYDNR